MASEQVRFGILGCAGIAEKVCVAIAEADNATVYAVGSRTKEKAEAFIVKHCPGACAYDSYDAVLEDPKVQAVYIPLPTGLRAAWVFKAATKKKHILCEKPISGSKEETLKIFEACKAEGVQIMDDTMFMHNPRLAGMRTALDNTTMFGTPYHVVSSFSLPFGRTNPDWAASNVRMKKDMEPLGALGDLGWYTTRFTLWAFDFEQPEAVSCHFLETTEEGVPLRLTATMKFSGGRSAQFDCSFMHAWRQWGEVTSEKCTLRVDDFVIPAKSETCSYTISQGSCGDRSLTFPCEEIETKSFTGKAQHTLLIEKLASLVTSGTIDNHWATIAQQTNLLLLSLVISAENGGAWTPTN